MASETDLDGDIATLKARVETLKGQVRLHANALLNTESTRQAIASTARSSTEPLRIRLEKQQAYNQQCLYRACAAVTTFRVRDPDPNAVDHGNVLGIRIEVMTRARFIRPYYVLLNCPERRPFLRVHRHTVPACIPLNGLASRYLPAPRSKSAVNDHDGISPKPERAQDLSRFVRSLRREIVRYHNRVAVVADLRKVMGLDGKRKDAKDLAKKSSIMAISAADAETKQLRIDWKDGRSGRLVIGDDGDVVNLVVLGDRGRERDVTRELLSGGSRLESVARALAAM